MAIAHGSDCPTAGTSFLIVVGMRFDQMHEG